VADFIRQATIQLDFSVAGRFRAYQSNEDRRHGNRPRNHEVVFAALNALDGRYAEVVEARRPQAPEGLRFGRPVPGRQAAGSQLRSQVNFRPTVAEKKEIIRLARAAGADSVSAFLNAVLDEFLPPAPRKRT